jgi:hypothetical protein
MPNIKSTYVDPTKKKKKKEEKVDDEVEIYELKGKINIIDN